MFKKLMAKLKLKVTKSIIKSSMGTNIKADIASGILGSDLDMYVIHTQIFNDISIVSLLAQCWKVTVEDAYNRVIDEIDKNVLIPNSINIKCCSKSPCVDGVFSFIIPSVSKNTKQKQKMAQQMCDTIYKMCEEIVVGKGE